MRNASMTTIAQQTPVVSIVCITFMHEKYIRQTLDGFVFIRII